MATTAPRPAEPRPPALDVRLLWLPEAMPGTLFAAVDVLRAVSVLHRLRRPGEPVPLRWRVVDGAGRRIALPWLPDATAAGRRRAPFTAGAPANELLVLPGLGADDAPHLGELMARHAGALRLVQQHMARGGWLSACFSAVVIPAHLGLLDGQRVSAPWPYLSWLRREYPRADFGATEPLRQAGRVFCCVAPELATGGMLQALRQLLDADLADAAAQVLQHQPERQAQVPALAQQQWLARTSDSPVQRAMQWLQQHIEHPYALKDVATAAAASERTLLRQFRLVTGQTPLQYLQGLRVARAQLLLETTLHGHDAIATACGYADTASLRRLFRQATGLSLSDWRARHTLRARRPHWKARSRG